MQDDGEKPIFLTKGDHVTISNCFMDLEEGIDDLRLISFLKRENPFRNVVVVIGHDFSANGNLVFFSEAVFPINTRGRLVHQLKNLDPSLKDKSDNLFIISREREKMLSYVLYNPLQNSLAMCNVHDCFEVDRVSTFIRLCDHNHLICKSHLKDEKSPDWHRYLLQLAEHNEHLQEGTEDEQRAKKQTLLGVCSACNLDPDNIQHQILFRTMLMHPQVACPLFHNRRLLCSINLTHLQLEMERFSSQEPASNPEMKVDKADEKATNLNHRIAPMRVSIINNDNAKQAKSRDNQGQGTYSPLPLAPAPASSSSLSSGKNKALVVDLIDESNNDDQAAPPKATARQCSKDSTATTKPKVYGSKGAAKAIAKDVDSVAEWQEVDKSKAPAKTNKRKTKADTNNTANNKKKKTTKKSTEEQIDDLSSIEGAEPPVDKKKLKSNKSNSTSKNGTINNWLDSQGDGPVEIHSRRRSSRDYEHYGETIATRKRVARVIEAAVSKGKLLGHIELVMCEQDEDSLAKMDIGTLLSLVAVKEVEQPDIVPASPEIIDIDAFDIEEDQPPSKKKFNGKPVILFVEQPEDMSKGIIQVTVKTDMQYDDVLREVCKKLNFTRKRTQYMLVKVESQGWNRKIEYERLKSSRTNMWGILDEGELVQVRQVQSAYLGGRYVLSFIASLDRGNRSMKRKIKELSEDYEGYLEIRGDGNCYYRAVIYGVLEQAINRADRAQRLHVLHETLLAATFTEEEHEIEVHHKRLLDAILAAADGRSWTTLRELESDILMESTGFDQALIVVGKKLVVKYLYEHQDADWNGITPKIAVMASGQYETFEVYCEAEIMKMGECAEGIHVDIGVLPMLLNAYAEIVMLDRNEDVGILKKGGADQALGNGDKERAFSISLLFRPGHYDLLYKHEELPKYFMSSYLLPEIDRTIIEQEEEEEANVVEEQTYVKKEAVVEEGDADLTDNEQLPSSSTAAGQKTPESLSLSKFKGNKRKFSGKSSSASAVDHHEPDFDESKPKARKRSGSNETDIMSESELTNTVPQTMNDSEYFH